MKNILLTGPPGCGKTTLIREVLRRLKDLKAGGFFTSEIREKGARVGFKISSLDGKESILSHLNFQGPYKVSKYTVSIENLENIGLRALEDALQNADLIVIDEIGKMELFSEKIKRAILLALDSRKKVLGTIMRSSHPFADEIKKRRDTEIIELTIKNRREILDEIVNRLRT